MSRQSKAGWWWNIPIVLLIGILVPLGIRSVITDDNRYGWGTFSKQVVYRIEYYRVYDDGRIERYRPGRELKGKARKRLERFGNTRNSIGALKSWVNNYLEYLYENRRGKNIRTVRADIFYAINKNRNMGRDTNSNKLTIEYPAEEQGSN